MASSSKFVLNKFPERVGKGSMRMTIKSQPIHVDLDEKRLASMVAPALRDEIEAGIQAITEKASKATLKRSKGRRSDRLFNATGKLASRLGLSPDGASVAIVAPSDRLRGKTAELFERLRELVPVLREPRKLLEARRVRAAQEKAAGSIHIAGW